MWTCWHLPGSCVLLIRRGLDLVSSHDPSLQGFAGGGIEAAAAGDERQCPLTRVAHDVVLDALWSEFRGRVRLRPLHGVLVIFPVLTDDADDVALGQITHVPEHRRAGAPVRSRIVVVDMPCQDDIAALTDLAQWLIPGDDP